MQERWRRDAHLDIERVHALKAGIPLELIVFQDTPVPKEGWGVILLDNLPFYFRATRRTSLQDVRLSFAGEGVAGSETHKTSWWSHAPYIPSEFTPPIFAGEITDEHKRFFLRSLGLEYRVKLARGSVLDKDYKREIGRRKQEFEAVFNKYRGDQEFGAAVTIACEEKFSIVREVTVKEWGPAVED